MIQTEPATRGYCDDNGQFMGVTMVQHDTKGAFYFLHRNLLKWDVTKPGEKAWSIIKRFYSNAQTREYHFGYSSANGHYYLDLKGDVEELSFTGLLYNYEAVCTRYLEELRTSPFYHQFVTYSHFAKYRYPRELAFNLTGTAPVPASLP
jgi:alpha 1,2-mannosyltransferase